MQGPLRDFASVVLSAVKDVDYAIEVQQAGGYVTVVALHGGGIEPLTGELAAAIAGREHSLYTFRGLRETGNDGLRISPLRSNEMRLDNLISRSKTVLSIAGAVDVGMTVQVGGSNETLRNLLLHTLEEAGLDARFSDTPGTDHSKAYFFNRAEQGGVQLELSAALRASMLDAPLHGFCWQDPSCWNDRFYHFVRIVRRALALYVAADRTDLAKTMERFERTTRRVPRWMRSGGHTHHEEQDEDGS